MKNIRAKRETSREYLMKLMYQTYISNGDITDLENEMEEFLQNNKEYIVSRYKELVLTYSDKDVDFEGLSLENNAKNWSINRFSKIDLAILQIAIAEILSDLNIPDRVSINEAIDLAKMYCEAKTPKFINGILGSVVNEIKER